MCIKIDTIKPVTGLKGGIALSENQEPAHILGKIAFNLERLRKTDKNYSMILDRKETVSGHLLNAMKDNSSLIGLIETLNALFEEEKRFVIEQAYCQGLRDGVELREKVSD